MVSIPESRKQSLYRSLAFWDIFMVFSFSHFSNARALILFTLFGIYILVIEVHPTNAPSSIISNPFCIEILVSETQSAKAL